MRNMSNIGTLKRLSEKVKNLKKLNSSKIDYPGTKTYIEKCKKSDRSLQEDLLQYDIAYLKSPRIYIR
jgi:hypothetical protein